MIGPHEGRELELMLSGRKPLSMFVEPADIEWEIFPEDEFDGLVSSGRLKKTVMYETAPSPTGGTEEIRRVIYSLPEEEWRIEVLCFVIRTYDSLGPGWNSDLERIIGTLLGYKQSDIQDFVELHQPAKG